MINRPVEEVFTFMHAPNNDALWQSGIEELSQISEGPLGVGTEFWDVRRFLGMRIETVGECTEHECPTAGSVQEHSGAHSSPG